MSLKRMAAAAALMAGSVLGAAPDCSVVPGWSRSGEVRTFVPDNLFDYMNGNAEGYLIYGFRKMTGVTCEKDGDRVVIDISEMESPEMAFGIFAANRHPRFPTRKIGMIGQVMPRKATFVKGNRYVEIAANRDMEETLAAFAEALEPEVPGTTEAPAALGWFPPEGLEEGSVRPVPQSVLGLRMLERGWIARYGDGRAFVIHEETAEAAAGVLEALGRRLRETAAVELGDEAVQGRDRFLGRMCVARKGNALAGFVTRKAEADACARVGAILERIP